jgi:hypothetical protein
VIEVHSNTDALFATPSQCALATRAARMFDTDPIQLALAEMFEIAKSQPQANLPSGAKTLHQAMEEMAFAFVIRNLNADPLQLQILWDQNPPYCCDGVSIPGSRAIGNNPDNIYRRIPLDHQEHYRLRGRLIGPPSPDIRFSVLPHFSVQAHWQQTTLALADIDVDTNGEFELTLNNRSPDSQENNHVHLAPGAVRMTVRESMTDWATDTPLALELVRESQGHAANVEVGENPEDLSMQLPAFAEHWLSFNNNTYYAHPSNTLPVAKKPPGGLTGQTSAMGNYALAPDEVLVIKAKRLDASYFSFAVMDPWMRCADFENRTASLTSDQAIADRDGCYRVVLALHDPGVKNWLDPGGLGQGTLQIRWQGIPGELRPPHNFFEVQKTTLEQLKTLLPAETTWLSPDERAENLAARKQSFERRFTLRASREHA